MTQFQQFNSKFICKTPAVNYVWQKTSACTKEI